jgi:hypothetical protein
MTGFASCASTETSSAETLVAGHQLRLGGESARDPDTLAQSSENACGQRPIVSRGRPTFAIRSSSRAFRAGADRDAEPRGELRCKRLTLQADGAPEEIRTPDPQIRSLVLYPAELRARCRFREQSRAGRAHSYRVGPHMASRGLARRETIRPCRLPQDHAVQHDDSRRLIETIVVTLRRFSITERTNVAMKLPRQGLKFPDSTREPQGRTPAGPVRLL